MAARNPPAKRKAPARKRGRPTDYKPEYCAQLLEHMTEGLSIEAFASVIGVAKQTLYTWTEKHAEFFTYWRPVIRISERADTWVIVGGLRVIPFDDTK